MIDYALFSLKSVLKKESQDFETFEKCSILPIGLNNIKPLINKLKLIYALRRKQGQRETRLQPIPT